MINLGWVALRHGGTSILYCKPVGVRPVRRPPSGLPSNTSGPAQDLHGGQGLLAIEAMSHNDLGVILSMRTIGRVVGQGRWRECLVRTELAGVTRRRCGCCTLVLHPAALTLKCQPVQVRSYGDIFVYLGDPSVIYPEPTETEGAAGRALCSLTEADKGGPRQSAANPRRRN